MDDQKNVGSMRIALGNRIRAARKFLGQTQAQFAARLGVARLAVISYESGLTTPTLDQLCTFDLLGLDASYIAFGRPSLHSPEARGQFLAVMKWVNEVCALRSLDLSEEDRMEVSWSAYCRLAELSRHTGQAPDQDALQSTVVNAMSMADA